VKRIWTVLAFAGALLGAKLAHELYRWVAYAEERALLLELREQVVDAGAELIRATLSADSLHAIIQADDRALRSGERGVERYERFARDGALPGHLYDAYRADVSAYRQQVAQRNRRAEEWNALTARRRGAAERYDLLADSVRSIAARIGDPFFPVPLPAEAALEQGVEPPRGMGARRAETAGGVRP
jgi:hypothetical protein